MALAFRILVLALVAAWLPLEPARAQTYEPITSSGYTAEYFDATVSGSSRIMGMGGAFSAVAEGVAAFTKNPAALANRFPYSTDWWDYDIAFDWLVPGIGTDMDIENTGLTSDGSAFTFFMVGGSLQFGHLGLGLYIRGRTYTVGFDEGLEPRSYEFGLAETNIGVAYELIDGVLYLGGSLGASFMDVTELDPQAPDDEGVGLVHFDTGFFRLGALWKPPLSSWAFGLSLATGGQLSKTEGDADEVAGKLLPGSLHRPWELSLGAAYTYKLLLTPEDRRFVRAAADIVLYGTSPGATTMSGFISQLSQPAGEYPSFGLHLGGESEVWHNRLQVRLGTYFEPSRVTGRWGRWHGTFGFDLKLFELIWVWKLSVAFDFAGNYSNSSFGLGFWH